MLNELTNKKGYYVHFDAKVSSIGVSNKIDMQINQFSKYFEIEEINIMLTPRTIIRKCCERLPWIGRKRNYQEAEGRIKTPEFLYVRRTGADKDYINFFKMIKRNYPNTKIIVEIFTYPYDRDDFISKKAWFLYVKELIYRPYLKKYIDRFVVYTEAECVFGIPTIRTINGIDIDDYKPIKVNEHDSINLLSVAYMQQHHGYERIIQGMIDYYKNGGKRKLFFHMVGDGPELNKYKELAESGGILDKIVFYGNKSGKALEEIYNFSDIGVASFGTYKFKVYNLSALKTREYLAKGLPMITGCKIDVLDDKYKYCRTYTNDNTNVDIENVIDFYDSIYSGNESRAEIISKIREFAEITVDNAIVMKPIIDYIMSKGL